jgi:hypothetical protein
MQTNRLAGPTRDASHFRPEYDDIGGWIIDKAGQPGPNRQSMPRFGQTGLQNSRQG